MVNWSWQECISIILTSHLFRLLFPQSVFPIGLYFTVYGIGVENPQQSAIVIVAWAFVYGCVEGLRLFMVCNSASCVGE